MIILNFHIYLVRPSFEFTPTSMKWDYDSRMNNLNYFLCILFVRSNVYSSFVCEQIELFYIYF